MHIQYTVYVKTSVMTNENSALPSQTPDTHQKNRTPNFWIVFYVKLANDGYRQLTLLAEPFSSTISFSKSFFFLHSTSLLFSHPAFFHKFHYCTASRFHIKWWKIHACALYTSCCLGRSLDFPWHNKELELYWGISAQTWPIHAHLFECLWISHI